MVADFLNFIFSFILGILFALKVAGRKKKRSRNDSSNPIKFLIDSVSNIPVPAVESPSKNRRIDRIDQADYDYFTPDYIAKTRNRDTNLKLEPVARLATVEYLDPEKVADEAPSAHHEEGSQGEK